MAIIARQKLTGLGDHWGVLQTDGTVFHITQDHGVQVVSFQGFAAGKNVRTVRLILPSEHQAVMWRIYNELMNPKAYHLLENNCEMVANRVAGSQPQSPQVQFWAVVAGVTCIALAARA
jgi:FtsP/CotA-like multicopper oxidase with cupredoxin domain